MERIANIDRAHLHSFVMRNTTVGTVIVTDGNTAYRRLPGRTHDEINLSAEDAPAAHIALPWVHRVFSNFKRWASGTYHGIREKHVDIYCNEFVFRWNRRRHFQTNIDTMLGLGHKIGQVTWRGIVGDTRKWKYEHFEQIVSMLKPERYVEAFYYMHDHQVDFFDALDAIRRKDPRKFTGGKELFDLSCQPVVQARHETLSATGIRQSFLMTSRKSFFSSQSGQRSLARVHENLWTSPPLWRAEETSRSESDHPHLTGAILPSNFYHWLCRPSIWLENKLVLIHN